MERWSTFLYSVPILFEGKIVGISKIARDITAAKASTARQILAAQELNHRTKNLLSVADCNRAADVEVIST